MRDLLTNQACKVLAAFAQLALGNSLNPSEWRHYTPLLASQVRALQPGETDSLLAQVCRTRVAVLPGIGPTCTTRRLGAGFSDIVDEKFHPKGVIFGHFLGTNSDDAAISGWSAETHPARWGGTLLLSRRDGRWIPVWYRSALIVDSCEKIALPHGREILLCEDEDSGMGHALHYLYTVDFEHPSDLDHALLAKADSFRDSCVNQKQVLNGPHWRKDRQEFSVEIATTVWQRLSTEPYCAEYPKRHPSHIQRRFAVTPDGLREAKTDVTPSRLSTTVLQIKQDRVQLFCPNPRQGQ